MSLNALVVYPDRTHKPDIDNTISVLTRGDFIVWWTLEDIYEHLGYVSVREASEALCTFDKAHGGVFCLRENVPDHLRCVGDVGLLILALHSPDQKVAWDFYGWLSSYGMNAARDELHQILEVMQQEEKWLS